MGLNPGGLSKFVNIQELFRCMDYIRLDIIAGLEELLVFLEGLIKHDEV
jgi:hypothetical protein